MFPNEVYFKIFGNFDNETLDIFASTCHYFDELINDNKFAIFCEKYDFTPDDNKKEIFEILQNENIDLEDVYLDCLDFDTNTIEFIFRNCEKLYLGGLSILDITSLPRCKKLSLSCSTLNTLPHLPECEILAIHDSYFENSLEDCILEKCSIIYLTNMELDSFPKIPECKVLLMAYCNIDVNIELSNCEIIAHIYNNYSNLSNFDNINSCRLLITDYGSIQCDIPSGGIIHCIIEDYYKEIPFVRMNINNRILIINKSREGFEKLSDIIDNYEDYAYKCIDTYISIYLDKINYS